jgi:hypothetical protein
MSRRAFMGAAASTLVTSTALFPRSSHAAEVLWVPGMEIPPERDFVSARLILCRDASGSMFVGEDNPIDKYGIQRTSTAGALASHDVQSLIVGQQGVILGDVQYSDDAMLSVGLAFVDTPEKVAAYASLILNAPTFDTPRGTILNKGMAFAGSMFAACPVNSSITALDVSGDGQIGDSIGGSCKVEAMRLAEN